MFTGIIQHKSKIRNIEYLSKDQIFYIEPFRSDKNYQQGESIAINGVCLTLTDFSHDYLQMYASQETLQRTNLSQCKIGNQVNVEQALKLGDRLGGHFVSGHVDTQAVFTHSHQIGRSKHLTFSIDKQYGSYLIPKGSITLDGISLTLNQCSKELFTVNVIPETLERTTLASWTKGYQANVEIDLLSKHIYQYVTQAKNNTPVHQEWLREYGYE
jgi:riboflavin synthase